MQKRCPASGSSGSILVLILSSLSLYAVGTFAQEPFQTHAGLIRNWNQESFARGQRLYETLCVTCHGTPEREGSIPTSRPFWKEPFKNGNDPYNIFKTIGDGLGQMPAWPWLEAGMRYDLINFIREEFLKPHNPSAYFPITPEYLASLPRENLSTALDQQAVEFMKGPKYLRMDFGPSLNWTYQVAPGNIAYKGIAVRLDPGRGGVSKGRAWMVYDHDTMRAAAAWTGDEFVDWKGIAFDGSHGTHTGIVGEKRFVNPPGPGWADPRTGRFDDPRLPGRDGKLYGPLPREWAHFKGFYRHGERVVLSYTVGDAQILETPGFSPEGFSRTLNIGRSSRDLLARICPAELPAALGGNSDARIILQDGFHLLHVPAQATPLNIQVIIGARNVNRAAPPEDLRPLIQGGPPQWNFPMSTRGVLGDAQHPFTADVITPPSDEQNPWQSWMRLGGFDFYPDGDRAAVCTWMGEVWLVSGLLGDLQQLTWKRIAAGLFQPLGLKIVEGGIYVTCRDQIARLHDLNGDEEIDFYESFNNDHQVTEHFHEFAMGLQTDRDGNFYYAKSARHALPALVPHHGTLLRVARDGSRTDILATGFRAANGVCVNDDGTFFVTDQEGHWTPKNRINLVRPGGFYGNMMGYHNRTNTADSAMEQPVVWITNEMDRSPGELLRVTSDRWGPLQGSLLNLSYGTGRIYLVPMQKVNGQFQGAVIPLPMPELPTGVMRGRFNPKNGHLYGCGLFAWAGNRTADGGFYRIRPTGTSMHLPAAITASKRSLTLAFTDPLDKTAAENPASYAVKAWSLKRSANYGSKHHDEHALPVTAAELASDARTVRLTIPDLAPTWGMEIRCELRGADGEPFTRLIHNTVHALE